MVDRTGQRVWEVLVRTRFRGTRGILTGVTLLLACEMSFAQSVEYSSALPPQDAVMSALAQSPQVQAAQERLMMASAQKQRTEAGDYEWTLGVTGQRRTDAIGATFSEQSYELSRGMRWFGKGSIDRQLGSQTVSVGERTFGDAWHEAARSMLAGWFEWLRAADTARQLGAQRKLLEEQLQRVQSRVRAGDAPRVEQSLAQTEVDRANAAQLAAELHVQAAALQLKSSFPNLPLVASPELEAPPSPSGSDEEWTRRILGDNHEIALAEGQHEQSKLRARRARLNRIPDPTVGLRYSNNLDGNDRLLGVVVSVPIGGARRSAEAAVALRESNIAGQHARATRLKVEGEAQRAILTMRSNYTKWQRLSNVAAQSEAGASAVARGYELGEFSITDLVTARRQAFDAQLDASRAQMDALEAASRLRLDAHEIWSVEETPQE